MAPPRRQRVFVGSIFSVVLCIGLAERDMDSAGLGVSRAYEVVVTQHAPLRMLGRESLIRAGQGSNASLVNRGGLAGRSDKSGTITLAERSFEENKKVRPITEAQAAAIAKQGAKVEPVAGGTATQKASSSNISPEEATEEQELKCFPVTVDGHSVAQECCDKDKGPQGDEDCWSKSFTYDMCCDEKQLKRRAALLEDHLQDILSHFTQENGSKTTTCDIKLDDFDERTADPSLIDDCHLHYCMVEVCGLKEGDCTDCPNDNIILKGKRRRGDTISKIQECYQRIPEMFVLEWIRTPLIIWAIHLALAPISRWFYKRHCVVGSQFKHYIVTYVGTSEIPPLHPSMISILMVAEAISSAFYVFLYTNVACIEFYDFPGWPWVLPKDALIIEYCIAWGRFIMNFVMLVTFYVEWLMAGFAVTHLFTIPAILDLFTVHTYYWRSFNFKRMHPERLHSYDPYFDLLHLARPQLNTLFLRANRAYTSFAKLTAIGSLDYVDKVTLQWIKSFVRLFSLVIISAGAIICATWLGYDLERSGTLDEKRDDFGECRAEPKVANLLVCSNFFTAIYWIITTITTVGYGDFTPTSNITYLLVIVIIVAGVTFFTVESGIILDAIDIADKGKGEYFKGKGFLRKDHVIVTGGAVHKVCGEAITPFLDYMLARSWVEDGRRHPEVLILGPVPKDDIAECWEGLNPTLQRMVKFIEGSPMSKVDLHRAQGREASFIYVIPNLNADDQRAEDRFNIQVALSLKKLVPGSDINMRMMLFQQESMDLAQDCGISKTCLLCLSSVNAYLTGPSLTVHGWSSLMCSLFSSALSFTPEESEYLECCQVPKEFLRSVSVIPWMITVHPRKRDVPFHKLCLEIYIRSGCLLIGADVGAGTQIFPRDSKMPPRAHGLIISRNDPVNVPALSEYFVSAHPSDRAANKGRLAKQRVLAPVAERVSGSSDDDVASEEQLQDMKAKAQRFKREERFSLVVIASYPNPLASEDDQKSEKLRLWSKVEEFIFSVQDSVHDVLEDQMRLIILSADRPPQKMVASAIAETFPVAYMHGDILNREVLEDSGVCECRAIVSFGRRIASADPKDDRNTYFLMEVLRGINLKPDCHIFVELSSGTVGSHVLPDIRTVKMGVMDHLPDTLPVEPAACGQHANLWCVGGHAFMPKILLSLIAGSYYNEGIVSLLQSFTSDLATSYFKPIQITLPKEFCGQPYKTIVQSAMGGDGKLGPSVALPLGILRRTPVSNVVLLHPDASFVTEENDLLTVIADARWATWCQEQGIRCVAGVPVANRSLRTRATEYVDIAHVPTL